MGSWLSQHQAFPHSSTACGSGCDLRVTLCCVSGAAHNSRSTAGTPAALHQQHLTPAQQATQAAITAPATHQDGKVPVRTGLAWAALGALVKFLELLLVGYYSHYCVQITCVDVCYGASGLPRCWLCSLSSLPLLFHHTDFVLSQC